MPKKITEEQRESVRILLSSAADAQSDLWSLLHDIEELLDIEVDSNEDLSILSVDDLISRR